MSDAENSDRSNGPSDEELLRRLGRAFRDVPIKYLNQALLIHGGTPLTIGDKACPMANYIKPEKLKDVLIDARRFAKEDGVTFPRTIEPESVVTDKDAARFVLGY